MHKSIHIVMASALTLSMAVFAHAAGASARTPNASASAPARRAAQAGGRSLTVKITGLAKGTRARVHIVGPGHYSKTVAATTTLRGLRVGKYTAISSPISVAKGAHIYPTHNRATSTVTAKHAATLAVRYLTLIPKTTKPVSARTISVVRHIAHGRTVVKFPGSRSLKRGDIIAAGVSKAIPHGLIAKVVSRNSDGSVVTTPATLLDAVPSGTIDTVATLDAAHASRALLRHGFYFARTGDVKKDVDGPLATCKGSVTAKVEGSLSIAPSFHVSATWSWLHGVTSAQVTGDITESTQLEASVSAAGSCEGERDLFAKPLTFATFVVEVGPIPVVLQPQLQITLKGSASVKAAVTTSASQSLTISAGLRWTRDHGVAPISSVTNKHSYQPPTLTASGDVSVSVNPEINLLIEGVGGPEIGLTGELKLSADVNANPWWELDASLAGNVGFSVPLLKFDKRAQFARKTWVIAHAPVRATPTIDVYPDGDSEGYPWSAQACGDGGSFDDIEVVGHDFVPNEKVTVSTGWGLAFGGTADGDGGFDLSANIGEVASADHTPYSIEVDGDHGSVVYGGVTLNSNSSRSVSEDADGNVTISWCGNGFDPDTELDLVIDGDYIDSTYTDDGGSGGTTTTFACPSSGEYSYDVEGTDNDHSEHIADGPLDLTCTPAADASTSTRVAHRAVRATSSMS